ncbi:MAG: hypothetical protein F9K31_06500 [Dokdonella sp.]|nr:MAG: hypothetical protein F9K31_06500 [Dokdonella sp.]
MAAPIDPQAIAAWMNQTPQVLTAWAARQAIGDAVLIVLRDRVLTRESLLDQLQRMADGTDREWKGVRAAAAKAREFIAAPPPSLPAWSAAP